MGDINSTSAISEKVKMLVTSSEEVEVAVFHHHVLENPFTAESGNEQLFQLSNTKNDLGSE